MLRSCWIDYKSSFWKADGESDVEIIAFVLDVIDHKKYNKKFGYKKK